MFTDNKIFRIIFISPILFLCLCNSRNETRYSDANKTVSLTKYEYDYVKSVPVPEGYERLSPDSNSFAYYLQNLELRKDDNTVYLYNGKRKSNQDVHYAVIKLDVGNKDLQQCADVIMRLRAEYLFKQNRHDEINFNFVSGFNCKWNKYAEGNRVIVKGNSVKWVKTAHPDYSYENFRNYLELIFTYAGTASLIHELYKVDNIGNMQIGDVFIQTGKPYGHAIIVLDIAVHKSTGKKIFILGQSYMPAQDFHILKNPNNMVLNPWYELNEGEELITPEWNFRDTDLMRFP